LDDEEHLKKLIPPLLLFFKENIENGVHKLINIPKVIVQKSNKIVKMSQN
jgi:hypothetical protein